MVHDQLGTTPFKWIARQHPFTRRQTQTGHCSVSLALSQLGLQLPMLAGIGAGEYLELVARSQGAQIGQPVVPINRCRRRLQGLVNVCQAAQPLKLTVRAEPSKQGIVAA